MRRDGCAWPVRETWRARRAAREMPQAAVNSRSARSQFSSSSHRPSSRWMKPAPVVRAISPRTLAFNGQQKHGAPLPHACFCRRRAVAARAWNQRDPRVRGGRHSRFLRRRCCRAAQGRSSPTLTIPITRRRKLGRARPGAAAYANAGDRHPDRVTPCGNAARRGCPSTVRRLSLNPGKATSQ
jgi:hypothetical protein